MSTPDLRRQLGLVRCGRVRVRQLSVAWHAEIIQSGRSERVRRGPRARVLEPVRRRLPVDTGHV